MRGQDNATPGQSTRLNIVRYDSPTIAGFTVSAAWGADDLGDVALTYTGTWNDFKVIAKGGYGQDNDNAILKCDGNPAAGADGRQHCEWMGAAGSIMHVPTGLYIYGGLGPGNRW